ncbi:hypothetical protein QQS21_005545 [Conoideocrella luteorostrata]|uniref:DUF7708 domain-containing protein n=1 Tax=Conoideocrella luteorostrata TaxID=1105319 RepID=A0AAJ0CPG0_9HYPO|nr:hypothetical protein QQS21_005545 [Conoideocrella luteorostrata]
MLEKQPHDGCVVLSTHCVEMTTLSSSLPTNSLVADKWQQAFHRCRHQLDSEDAATFLVVPSYEHAQVSVEAMGKTYKGNKTIKMLERISPLLDNLRSFSSVIYTAVQSNPVISALIWGGIKLVLEVGCCGLRKQCEIVRLNIFEVVLRSSGTIENIAEGFFELSKALPRFEDYGMLLQSAPRLNEALIDLYELIFRFLVEGIKVYRNSPTAQQTASRWRPE